MLVDAQDGLMGFDCDETLSYDKAKEFHDRGYRFVLRYIPRVKRKKIDLSLEEKDNIWNAGLALAPVQHVESSPWIPSAQKGESYGHKAVDECQALEIAPGTNVWLDLEGVDTSVPKTQIIKYCNVWYTIVVNAGYKPGLYVGYGTRLNGYELYHRLLFESYWGAYNVNSDEFPDVRGFQMKQRVARHGEIIGIQYDINIVHKDGKGGLPKFDAPDEWSA